MTRRFTKRHERELKEFAKREHPEQPNVGSCECPIEACGLVFTSEAGFAYHQRPASRPGRSTYRTECLNPRQLLRSGFSERGTIWKTPRWIEMWYLDELKKEGHKALSGFLPEAWTS